NVFQIKFRQYGGDCETAPAYSVNPTAGWRRVTLSICSIPCSEACELDVGCRAAEGPAGCFQLMTEPSVQTKPGSPNHSRKGFRCKFYTRSPARSSAISKKSPTRIDTGRITARNVRPGIL